MQANQPRLYIPRFRVWLNNGSYRQYVYPLVIASCIYALALMGGIVIGGTQYGILAVGGIVALIGAFVIGIYPSMGAYILVFFVYANISEVLEFNFDVPDTNKILVSLILVGTLARRVMIDDKPIIFRGTEMSVFAMGLVIVLSLVFGAGRDRADAVSVTLDWTKNIIIFFILVQFSLEEKVWKNTHLILIGTAGLLSITSVIQGLTRNTSIMFFGLANAPAIESGGGSTTLRVIGPIDDPNFYAMFLVMALPVAYYVGLTSKKRLTRILCSFISITILAAILFTYSRGALLAVLVVGVLTVIERKMNPYRIAFIVFILATVLSLIAPAGFSERVHSITSLFDGNSVDDDDSFRGRSSEMQVALLMFQDYPVIGIGSENYESYYLSYSYIIGLDDRLENRQAHSLYLELLAEQGIIGFSAFMIMLLFIYRGLFHAKRLLRELNRDDLAARVVGIQLGLTGYLLTSLFLHGSYQRYLFLILALAAACSAFANHFAETYEAQEQPYLLVDSTQVS